jgi:hypothetical protein
MSGKANCGLAMHADKCPVDPRREQTVDHHPANRGSWHAAFTIATTPRPATLYNTVVTTGPVGPRA